MKEHRFDRLTRTLGDGATRRGVLGGLAVLVGLGLEEVAARRRQRRRGKSRNRAAQAHPDKVALCHHDAEDDTYHRITVGAPAAEAHLAHHAGDFLLDADDCCGDADCAEGQSCDEGECVNCPKGTIELVHGGCAIPCSDEEPCPGGCFCEGFDHPGEPFLVCLSSTSPGSGMCNNTTDCPPEEVCSGAGDCFSLCTLT